MQHRPLLLVALLAAFTMLAGPATAQPIPYHFPMVVDGVFELDAQAPEPHVCLVAAPGVERVVLAGPGGGEEIFPLEAGRAACRTLTTGNHTLVEGGPVRLVAFAAPMNVARNPGVYVLSGAGVSLLVDGLSPKGRIGLNVDAGHHVAVFALDTVQVVDVFQGPMEDNKAVSGGDDTHDTRYVIAVNQATVGGEVRVMWEDPQWFRPEPTIGHVAVVIAALLFIVFYKPAPKDERHLG